MPDDPNAALIERMADAWLDGCADESVDFAMSRVLAVVREHIAQKMDDEARARIATLTAERDEALRRRDAWRAKAEGYDEMAATVRAKVKEAGPSSPRALLRAALVEADGRIAGLCDALTMMLAAREADGVAVDAAMLRARAELAKEIPE